MSKAIITNWSDAELSAYEHDRSQESRQARLHQMTEENLAKFETRMRAVDATLDARLQHQC